VYEAYYGLKSHPFSLVPDPGFLYLGSKHKVALSLLEYGLLHRAAFIVVTGEPGTGKTTLLNTILDRSEREVTLGVLSHTHAGLGSLLPWVLMTFGLDGKGMDSVELFTTFAGFLAKEHAQRRRVVLVVDEAHNLGTAMLEELRLLSNVNDGRRQPLQIILSGQPALRTLLQRPDLVQLAQRIGVDYHLEPLTEADTPRYIRHRLSVAGGSASLLSDLACRVVHRVTGGNPRLINQVCDIALAYGYAEDVRRIDAAVVVKAATDRRGNGILPLATLDPALLASEEERQAEREVLASVPPPTAAAQNGSPPAPASESSAALYKRAVAFKEAGAYKQAITLFERVLSDRTFAVKARTQMALCQQAQGHVDEAIASVQRLWTEQRGTPQELKQIRYLLARLLEGRGRLKEAVPHYRALREAQSDYRDVADRVSRLSEPAERSEPAPESHRTVWTRLLPPGWVQLLRSVF